MMTIYCINLPWTLAANLTFQNPGRQYTITYTVKKSTSCFRTKHPGRRTRLIFRQPDSLVLRLPLWLMEFLMESSSFLLQCTVNLAESWPSIYLPWTLAVSIRVPTLNHCWPSIDRPRTLATNLTTRSPGGQYTSTYLEPCGMLAICKPTLNPGPNIPTLNLEECWPAMDLPWTLAASIRLPTLNLAQCWPSIDLPWKLSANWATQNPGRQYTSTHEYLEPCGMLAICWPTLNHGRQYTL